jgi:cardiolipin synthase A/B
MSRRSHRRPRFPTYRGRIPLALSAVILLVVVAVLVWRSDPITPTAPTPTAPPTAAGIVGVFVEPDDGRTPVLDEIDAARRTVALEVYLLSDNDVVGALVRADRRGVRVRVILEEHPYGGAGNQPQVFARLEDAGVEVRWAPPPYRFAHIKTFVIDDAVALILTLNLTRASFTGNREFGAVTTRPAEVAQAAAIFEADWTQRADPPDGPLVVSPASSRRELLDLIGSARTSLDLYAEVVRDDAAVAALAAAERRGVAVRLLVPEVGEEEEGDQAVLDELAAAGVGVRTLDHLYVHAKVVIVDDRRAFLGSQNFTTTSLDQNRELGLLVDDPGALTRLNATFERDFAAAVPLA